MLPDITNKSRSDHDDEEKSNNHDLSLKMKDNLYAVIGKRVSFSTKIQEGEISKLLPMKQLSTTVTGPETPNMINSCIWIN